MLNIKFKQRKNKKWRLAFATLNAAILKQLQPNVRVKNLTDGLLGTVLSIDKQWLKVSWDNRLTERIAISNVEKILKVIPGKAPSTSSISSKSSKSNIKSKSVSLEEELSNDTDKLIEMAIEAELIDEADSTILSVELEDNNTRKQELIKKVVAIFNQNTQNNHIDDESEKPMDECDKALARLHAIQSGGSSTIDYVASNNKNIGSGGYTRSLADAAIDRTPVDLHNVPFDLDKGLGDAAIDQLAQAMGYVDDIDSADNINTVDNTIYTEHSKSQSMRRVMANTSSTANTLNTQNIPKPPAPPITPTIKGTSMEGLTGPRTAIIIPESERAGYQKTLADALSGLDWSTGVPKTELPKAGLPKAKVGLPKGGR